MGALVWGLATRGKYRLLAPVAGSFVYNFVENRKEQNMIFESDLVKDLALKYNFSIFDFHNSKKESQYMKLRDNVFKEFRLYSSSD